MNGAYLVRPRSHARGGFALASVFTIVAIGAIAHRRHERAVRVKQAPVGWVQPQDHVW